MLYNGIKAMKGGDTMKIGSIGYNYSHGSDFEMYRPNGIGCGLFLLIKSNAVFEINGITQNVKENSFVIMTRETTCRYRAAGNSYTDDWLYFSDENDELAEFERLEIPLNKPVHLGNVDELSSIMHILAYEHYSAENFHSEIEEYYIKILFMKLSRIIHSKPHLLSGTFAGRNHKFIELRNHIYAKPDNVGSIEEMAGVVGMSRSGFQHLYKKIFGVSVMTDVINGRIERAKRLLSSTNLTVKEIALKCGYAEEFNFMRQFKQRCGKTPTEYRKIL